MSLNLVNVTSFSEFKPFGLFKVRFQLGHIRINWIGFQKFNLYHVDKGLRDFTGTLTATFSEFRFSESLTSSSASFSLS